MNAGMVIAAVAGLGYGLFILGKPVSAWRAAAKTLPVALLAFLAGMAGGTSALVVALVLSALGDWFLAFRGEKYFLAGLGSFLLAHLAYCWLFGTQQSQSWAAGPAFLAGTILILVFVAGIYRRLAPHLGQMRFPVAAYCAVIGAMLATALGRGPDPYLLTGVALFAVSDLVLGFETFVIAPDSPARRWSGPFIWFAYFAGQWLITAAMLGLV